MANPVEEEIEAVQSIFSEELSVSEGPDGSKLVHYSVKDNLLLTVRLNGKRTEHRQQCNQF